MYKDIEFGDESRYGLYNGVKKLTDAVKVTMGPKGRNVLIQKEMGTPHITKDGVSVAKEIFLKDPIENMGAQIVKEVSANVAEDAGDGTTTATVLAHAIFKEGLRNVTAGANPVALKRGMDKTVEAIVKNLQAMSREVSTTEQIEQVATISANSDRTIGKLIAEAMDKVGKDGVITVEEAKGMVDELDVVEGMLIDRGYLSSYFVSDMDKNICEMKDPYILVTDAKLLNLKPIISILEQVQKTGRPLLIIADDIDGEAISSLVMNRLKGVLNVAAIKAPGFGDSSIEQLKDIAALTGAVPILSELNHKLESVNLEDLGTCGKLTITKDDTTIVDGKGNALDVLGRIGDIKNKLKTASGMDSELLQQRIAKLSGGVAVIKVGAVSETEMKEKKDRVDDALAATKSAVEEGIVIGGGCALLRACNELVLDTDGDEEIGVGIILKAVEAPLRQISENAGFDGGVIVNDVLRADDVTIGFDAATGEYEDMFDAGIIDPTKVVRVALQNATSVASLLLTTEATITIVDDVVDNSFRM